MVDFIGLAMSIGLSVVYLTIAGMRTSNIQFALKHVHKEAVKRVFSAPVLAIVRKADFRGSLEKMLEFTQGCFLVYIICMILSVLMSVIPNAPSELGYISTALNTIVFLVMFFSNEDEKKVMEEIEKKINVGEFKEGIELGEFVASGAEAAKDLADAMKTNNELYKHNRDNCDKETTTRQSQQYEASNSNDNDSECCESLAGLFCVLLFLATLLFTVFFFISLSDNELLWSGSGIRNPWKGAAPDSPECYTDSKGADYRGTKSTSAKGKTCKVWTSSAIAKSHSHWTAEERAAAGLGSHNYCRNPDGESRPWCYVSNDLHFQECDVGPPSSRCGSESQNQNQNQNQNNGPAYCPKAFPVCYTADGDCVTSACARGCSPWKYGVNYILYDGSRSDICNKDYSSSSQQVQFEYKVSSASFQPQSSDDPAAVCRTEYGSDWEVARFETDVVPLENRAAAIKFVTDLGFSSTPGTGDGTVIGAIKYQGIYEWERSIGDRVFYLVFQEKSKIPSSALVHATWHDVLWVGSWTNPKKVLCRKPQPDFRV